MGFCQKDAEFVKPRKKRPPRTSKTVSGRTRTRQVSKNDSFVKIHFLTDPPDLPEGFSDDRISLLERIVDTSGFLQSYGNPVDHLVFRELKFRRPNVSGYAPGCIEATSTVEVPHVLNWIQSYIPSEIPHDILEELVSSARSHFLNAVDPKVLFLNFLAELLELIHGGVKKVEELLELFKLYRKLYLEELARLVKRFGQRPENMYLAYQFAIKPFQSDMLKLLCIIEDAEKRTKWLFNNNHKPVRVLFRKKDVWPGPDFDLSQWQIGNLAYAMGPWDPTCPPWEEGCPQPLAEDLDGEYRLRAIHWSIDFCAQATVIYHLPPCRFSEDGSGIGLVLSSMLGTDRLGSFIWEAIPFSFVIDWFTDAGKQVANWIDGVTKNFPDGEILEMCHSFKLRSKWELGWYSPCGSDPEVGLFDYNRYQRQPGLPMVDRFRFNLGGLTGDYHLSLNTALVAQKLRRFAKRR